MINRLMQYIIVFLLLIAGPKLYAQNKTSNNLNQSKVLQQPNRILTIQAQLDTLAKTQLGLQSKMNFNFSQLNIKELFREMGRRSKINIDVDSKIDYKVVNNFSNVEVKEVLLYLCKQYHLDIEFTGSILHIKPFKKAIVYKPKTFVAQYNKSKQLITLDLKSDTLSFVCKKITNETGQNIVLEPDVRAQKVSVYIKDLPVFSAIEKLALANALDVLKQEDGTVVLSKKEKTTPQAKNNRGNTSRTRGRKNSKLLVKTDEKAPHLIDLDANGAPLNDVILELFEQTKTNYFIYSKLDGNVNVKIEKKTLPSILELISNNTKYYFQEIDSNTISYGERRVEGIRINRVIPIKYRDVKGLLEHFPSDLVKDIEIKEHPDLNSLVVSGSQKNIDEVIDFLFQIDQPIPVILIDVIILDYSNNKNLETGVKFGNAEEPVVSGGTMFPATDYNFSANSINKILGSIGRFDLLNLGGVNPNFYVSLKALETNGIIDIKSTPKLSALNGKEATFTNGREEYYLVEQTNTIGTQNPQIQTTQNWQSITASLDIKITPSVSLSGEVTLDVSFTQTSFTGRIAPTAPPGVADRSLTSTIRVSDGDMVLLGGLEEVTKNDSGSGVPLLSRIPILKWFFSSRKKSKSNSKLHVFIKPTVLY
ncbi:MAG: type II secretion system protein GspD [Flavobacteriales bacterium]